VPTPCERFGCRHLGTAFGWGCHKHISKNPFADVYVDVPRKIRRRETKAFRPEEAALILRAALAYTDPKTMQERARRWVPWSCAYSGARAGVITQMRGVDVQERSGFYVINITPEAGSTKTHAARFVPIHEHLIEQGFIEFVRRSGNGPLFYNPRTDALEQSDPLTPRRSRADTARAHLSDWVQEIGVTDAELKPTHAWRETFRQIADRGIIEKVHDEITGHAQKTIGRGYGRSTIEGLAEALKKFPRYNLD
jgi:integrase